MHDACRFQKLEIAIVEFLLIRLFLFFAFDQFRDGLFSLPLTFFCKLFFLWWERICTNHCRRRRKATLVFRFGAQKCPSRLYFVAEMRARTGYVWLASPYWGKRKLWPCSHGQGKEEKAGRDLALWMPSYGLWHFLYASHFAIENIGCISEIILRLN